MHVPLVLSVTLQVVDFQLLATLETLQTYPSLQYPLQLAFQSVTTLEIRDGQRPET